MPEEEEAPQVAGTLVFDYGLPASGQTLRLYQVGYAGSDQLLGETTTDATGTYTVPFQPVAGQVPNLQVRTVDQNGAEVVVSSSGTLVQPDQPLNLVVSGAAHPLDSEFARLSADVANIAGGFPGLAQAQESPDRQDLSVLAQNTGWDARILALGAISASLSQTAGLGGDVVYAMARAGLPTDAKRLALVDPAVVTKALGKANETGIVSLTDDQIAQATEAFTTFAQTTRLTISASGSGSTYGDLLSSSGLAAEQQTSFANLVFGESTRSASFWTDVAALGFEQATVDTLQAQGKLAYLTFNNAALTKKVQDDLETPDGLAGLVDKDLHTPDAWRAYLNDLAGGDAKTLDALVPPAYPGATTDVRVEAYVADLARKVRLSFPTEVTARVVETSGLSLGGADASQVATTLRTAATKGYELGRAPLNAFLAANPDVLSGLDETAAGNVTEAIKTLHRLTQITPSDESLVAAASLGVTSALDIAVFSANEFADRLGSAFPSVGEASLVYRRAQQITTSVLALAALAKQAAVSPPMYALSPTSESRQAAKDALVHQFPSLDSLMGSLDYCACDDCRSVLSPAAYLVDLLRFLDPSDVYWNAYLSKWKDQHQQRSYTDSFEKPYDALTERRPDIPNIELTCENTQTTLPYIDLVNEIFEYFVINGSLAATAAYTTGDAASADLAAEPQNTLPGAYGTLAATQYPVGLPFDLWFATVGGFLGYFGTPLWRLLEVFQPAESLELFDDVNHYPYYQAAVLATYLGLSPADYALLTVGDPIAGWFNLYGYADEATALTELASAKVLAERLGVTDQDLVSLVETGFVNSRLHELAPLGKAGLEPSQVLSYEGQVGYPPLDDTQRAGVEAALDALTARFNPTSAADGFDARTWLAQSWGSGVFDDVLVIADPDPDGGFAAARLQHGTGAAVGAATLLRLNLLQRLRGWLGWTLQDLDQSLTLFLGRLLPADSDAHLSQAFGAAMPGVVVQLAHLQRLHDLLGPSAPALGELLPMWTELAHVGSTSLYSRLFLTPSTVAADPVFDDPAGNYLAEAALIKDHLVALQAALGLSSDDIVVALADAARSPDHAGLTLDTAPLTMDVVSLLYRYACLASALRLTVPDLIELAQLAGVDPFEALPATPLTVAADDSMATQTLQLVDVASRVSSCGFSIDELRYLLRHQSDPAGPYRLDDTALMQLYRATGDAIAQIQAANSPPDDPLTFTDPVIRQKLALVFAPDVVQTFMGMWSGAIVYRAVQGGVAADQVLDPATLADFPRLTVSYDEVTQTQQLELTGVLLDADRTAIEASNGSAVLEGLLGSVQAQAQGFFSEYLEAATLGGQATGFLADTDLGELFAMPPADASDDVVQALSNAKRAELASALMPYLRAKLIRSAVVQTIAASLEADASLVDSLISSATLLQDPTVPSARLLDAFVGSATRGLSVTYTTAVGDPATVTVATADTADPVMPRPDDATSATFEGYLVAPSDGPYRFFAEIGKQDMQARLQFDIQANPLILSVASADHTEASGIVELKAGIPYHFSFEVSSLGDGQVSLLVQGESLPRGPLSRLSLYPEAAVVRFSRAQILLRKVIRLVTGLGLTEREVSYLVGHASDFGNLDLSSLPTQSSDDSLPAAANLFSQFLGLAAYADLRAEMAGGTDGLIDVFDSSRREFLASEDVEGAKSSALEDLYSLVAALTRRTPETVQAIAEQLAVTATGQVIDGQLVVTATAFSQQRSMSRLWEAMKLVQTVGIPAAVLASTTSIVDPSKTQEDRAAIAAGLRNAVKSHYTPNQWRAIAKSIFDPLRQSKRDALSSYLVEHLGLTDRNQLFEYFLVDPGMEPVVQTSRIRLALSSVQTFIQRCLLNIEPKVDPSAVPADQWAWMKRYRVWEANREIFLWPENWMEPEWRLDKTDLFQTLESTLFQGDVTADLAEDALLTYLRDLEGRARLDIVTMYREEVADDPAAATLHVIGRTHGKPRKHFYRKFAYGAWTAWEPVKVDIESDHIAVVIWRDRPYLFWVTFAPASTAGSPPSSGSDSSSKLSDVPLSHFTAALAGGSPQHQVRLVLHWSEYLKGKWSQPRSSDPSRGAPRNVPDDFDPLSVYVSVDKEFDASGAEGAVKVMLSYPAWCSFRLAGRNAEPELQDELYAIGQSYGYRFANAGTDASKVTGSGPMQVAFASTVVNPDGDDSETISTQTILQQGNRFALLYCDAPVMPLADQWTHWPTAESKMLAMPLFYQDIDSDVTMFVQPTLNETRVQQWPYWGITLQPAEPLLTTDDWWKAVPLIAQVPSVGPAVEVDPSSIVQIQPRVDWATHETTAVQFGTTLIGQRGQLTLSEVGAGSLTRLSGAKAADGLQEQTAATGVLGSVLSQGTSIGAFSGAGGLWSQLGSSGKVFVLPSSGPAAGTTLTAVGAGGLTLQHLASTQSSESHAVLLKAAAQQIQAGGGG